MAELIQIQFPLLHSARLQQLAPRTTVHMNQAMRTPHPLEVDRPCCQGLQPPRNVKWGEIKIR